MKTSILLLLALLAGSPAIAQVTAMTNAVFITTNYVYVPVHQMPGQSPPVALPVEEPSGGRLIPVAWGDMIAGIIITLITSLIAWWNKRQDNKVKTVLVDNINTIKKDLTKLSPAAAEEAVEKIKEDQKDAEVRQDVLKIYRPTKAEEPKVGP